MTRRRRYLLGGAQILAVVTALVMLLPLLTLGASSFASPAFETQWNSVESVLPNFWGPLATAREGQPESYVEGMYNADSGKRLVQYFDKARMEQTTPNGAVTNGLLTVELKTGTQQLGNATFQQYPGASIGLAGDAGSPGPTYASLAQLPEFEAKASGGVSRVYNASTNSFTVGTASADPNAVFTQYLADPANRYGQNIPKAFADFLAKIPGGPIPALGFPISPAFQASVRVNGTDNVPIIVQAFERRVLTYTPSNQPAFQVEFGNIGQHYYQWRYVTLVSGPATSTISGTFPASLSTLSTACAPATPTVGIGTPVPTNTPTPTVYNPALGTLVAQPTATPYLTTCPTETPYANGTVYARTATADQKNYDATSTAYITEYDATSTAILKDYNSTSTAYPLTATASYNGTSTALALLPTTTPVYNSTEISGTAFANLTAIPAGQTATAVAATGVALGPTQTAMAATNAAASTRVAATTTAIAATGTIPQGMSTRPSAPTIVSTPNTAQITQTAAAQTVVAGSVGASAQTATASVVSATQTSVAKTSVAQTATAIAMTPMQPMPNASTQTAAAGATATYQVCCVPKPPTRRPGT